MRKRRVLAWLLCAALLAGKGDLCGHALGLYGRPRVDLQWDGTEEGYVDWANASAGYRAGSTRVMISAFLYGDPDKVKLSDRDWTLDLGKQDVPAGRAGRREEEILLFDGNFP